MGLLSYLTLYYCNLGQTKVIGFALIVLWTSLLFSTIGIAASDFFCVNLSTISSLLGMSESMAGVTFLAFGNGSPDVFSTFAAIRTNSGSLAVGELIGAAGFITAVVSGSMALVRPFKVARKSFVRDVGFFIIAISFSMVFVANGYLELWECVAMVGFYFFYVFLVVAWHWWLGQRRKRREQHALARGGYADALNEGELDFEAEYREEDEPRTAATAARHPSLTELNNLERNTENSDSFDELDEETERDKWMGELSRNMRITKTPIGERRNIFNPIRPSLVGALEFQSVLKSLRKSRNIQAHPVNLRRFSDEPALTSTQQQANANSTTSDPEVASYSGNGNNFLETSISGSQAATSSTEPGIHGRGRAKSANAADLLGLSPTTWHQRQRSRSNLSSPRPASRYSDRGSLTVPGQTPSERSASPLPEAPSPIVTVEPPPDDHRRDTSPVGRKRSDTHNLLAPPASSGDMAIPQDDNQPKSKPQLRITPPSPSPEASQFASTSPPSQSSRTNFPRHRGIFREELVPSPESILLEGSQSFEVPPKPFRWWPYKILVPPETILQTLFPSLSAWHGKTWLGKITGIVSAPSFFLLAITLPVVEPQTGEQEGTDEVQGAASTLDSKQARQDAGSPTPGPGPDSLAQIAISTETHIRHANGSSDPRQQQVPQPELQEVHPHAAVSSPHEWNRWLVLIQCFTSPYVVLLGLWFNFIDGNIHSLLRPTLYCLLASSIAFLFVIFTTSADKPPKWHFLLCFAGFIVSVTWISTIANEVVGVLKTIGIVFNISDAILGLTIFAVGNSMGDLVADITVARLGYPVMALSACFGGPMLNILLGIGLSGCYMVISRADHRHHKHPDKDLKFKPYKVEVSTTLMVSAVALLVTLCGLLVVVPLNRWMMDRRIGVGLVVLWVVATAGNLGVELSGIGKADM